MYAAAAKLRKQHYYTRLNRQFSLVVHLSPALEQTSILRDPNVSSTPPLIIQTDASGLWGCGAVYNHHWLQLRWIEEWVHKDIMAKELVPVMLMTTVWGPLLARQQDLLHCDNLSLVTSINKVTAKPSLMMHLLHCLCMVFHSLL